MNADVEFQRWGRDPRAWPPQELIPTTYSARGMRDWAFRESFALEIVLSLIPLTTSFRLPANQKQKEYSLR